ncbi:MAG TPA: thiamine pyrophosphate-binding protein, partial [Methylomirabilota bacterium]|nr:thiamine pyrophosphate-binding protein [Methylomirabilota bacterium]
MGELDVMTDPAADTTDAPTTPMDERPGAELDDAPMQQPEIELPAERPEVETPDGPAEPPMELPVDPPVEMPTEAPIERPVEPPSAPAWEPPMDAPGAPGDQSPMQATMASEPPASADQATQAQDAPRTVGRLIADALRSAGVRYAFTVPGESFLGLLDALGEAGIRVVATRHEGAAAFMAEAHGQLTGRPAACMGTRAVGSANLAIGIHTARQDSTPMFALVGQVARAHRGHEAFQE